MAALVVRARSALLCRRGIEPSLGRWGFPQGYLELGESARDGAAREAWEEAGARVATGPLLAVYDVPGSVQLVYLSKLRPKQAGDAALLSAPGSDGDGIGPRPPETTEVAWFPLDATPPAEELAFPTVAWALARAQEVLAAAPPGVWRDDDDDDCDDASSDAAQRDAAAAAGRGAQGTAGAWFAPQQRAKSATPPGYVQW